MTKFLALLLLATVPAAAATPFTYYQDWFPGAQYAGLYAALDQGLFRQAGLDVTIHPFAFGQNQVALVDSDPARAAAGTMEGYIVLQKRAKGADLRVFAAVLRESPAGYMTLPGRPLASARDLVGKRVGVHKYGDPLYQLFLRRAGIDPSQSTMVFVDDDIGRLQRGEVDVMQGYAVEELVKLRRRVGPGAGFISFRQLGFDAYSEILFTTAAQLRAHGADCHRFVDVVRGGWRLASEHPDLAVDAVMARMPAGTDRSLVRDMLLATLPYVATPVPPILGEMDPAKWRGMSRACVEMGLLPKAEDPATFLAGAFSPPVRVLESTGSAPR